MICVSVDVPVVMLRRPPDRAVSPPVIIAILRGPVAAGSTLTTAVALVGELTVSDRTVMPVPNAAAESPCAKCVEEPVIATETFCCPCARLVGEKLLTIAEPGFTVNPLIRVATSLPVVTVTFRTPTGAKGSMLTVALAPVAELTVKDETMTPGPKSTVLAP